MAAFVIMMTWCLAFQPIIGLDDRIFGFKFYVPIDFKMTEDNVDQVHVFQPDFVDKSNVDNDVLDEISSCFDFKVDLLLPQVVFDVGNKFFQVELEQLEAGAGFVYLNSIAFMFQFDRQTNRVLPNQWQHFCFSFTKSSSDQGFSLHFVLNGKLLHDDLTGLPPLNMSVTRLNQDGISLGLGGKTADLFLNDKGLRLSLFHGQITGLKIWSTSLTIDTMIAVTGRDCLNKGRLLSNNGLIFDVETLAKTFSDNAYVTKTWTPVESICRADTSAIYRLSTMRVSYHESVHICQSTGGTLLIPKNFNHLNNVMKVAVESKLDVFESRCSGVIWVGGYKWDDNVFRDWDGKEIPYLPFLKGQPNGRDIQKCLAASNRGGEYLYWDDSCSKTWCFICELKRGNSIFSFRGSLPDDIDREYMNNREYDGGMMGFAGFQGTIIDWLDKVQSWYLSNTYTGSSVGKKIGYLDNNKKHPFGLNTWIIRNKTYNLKLSGCDPQTSFSCAKYGNCIPLDQRCNGDFDCPDDDISDEKECVRVNIDPQIYKKVQAPKETNGEPVNINVYLGLERISEVQVLDQLISIDINIRMTWFDSRLSYNNLWDNYSKNAIGYPDQEQIWMPELHFSNSKTMKIIVLDKHAFFSVIKDTNGSISGLFDPYENKVYQGKSNRLFVSRAYSVTLNCEFDLEMFPFDTQQCPLIITVPFKSTDNVNIQLKDWEASHGISMTQYTFAGFHPDLQKTHNKQIIVMMKINRVFTHHLFTTFLPTFCLIVIAEATLFIREAHFEATIMVTLTSMLVMYTLYQSVSNTLPQTAYLKMVDIWLLMGLILPFFIILILITMDSLHLEDKGNDVMVMGTTVKTWTGSMGWTKDNRHLKRRFVRSSKVIVPLFTFLGMFGFWVVALYHSF